MSSLHRLPASQFSVVEARLAQTLAKQLSMTAGQRPSPGELRSWDRSLPALASDLNDVGLGDVEMLLEYRLPLTSKRADVVLAGVSPATGLPTYLVVELKQWTHARRFEDSDVLVSVEGYPRPVTHPIDQVRGYCDYLTEFAAVLSEEPEAVGGVAYLHNATELGVEDLLRRPGDRTGRMFTGQRRGDFREFLHGYFAPTSGAAAADALLSSKIALDADLDTVAGGGSSFKAVRGEYGSGKTFFTRHLAERALRSGFAAAEVQISETETPLHKLETVYRRVTETLRSASTPPSAFRSVLDSWLYTLEGDVIATDGSLAGDEGRLGAEVARLLDKRLGDVSARTPTFALALRAYREALANDNVPAADALAAWMGGQPHVAAAAKREAGVRGDLDHFGAMGFLQGLLVVLRDAGHPGLLLVLDEVETLQRMRGDVRDKALNALRQLLDEIDAGRFPGLYLVITGTPAFYDGPSGVQRLTPLAGRLATDFTTDARFDNPRAVQIRLPGFSHGFLVEVGQRVRDVYAGGQPSADRVHRLVDDAYLGELADAVAGSLGGRVGVAPRLFLKKLVGDVLDRVDQFDDFDPRRHYSLTIGGEELSEAERGATAPRRPPAAATADDVELTL